MRGPIIVRRPGKADRHFIEPRHAIEYLLDHRGPAHVFAADGALLFTKGLPQAEA